jgi:small subunit ribosomal protein S1
VVAIGDTVEAIVLNVDKDHEKISLGLKQLEPDPWKALESKYPPGTRLNGKVRNLTNFGAFVEIEDGIDGLVHISDMSWAKRVRHPSEAVRKGDEVEVVVLEIDSAKRRISLGMKQIRENPWNELAKEYTIGTEVKGRITRILDRGAVVELKEDVEGFVPLSHLGIDNMKKPAEYFDVDMDIPLKVIKIDPQNKRIVLSVSAYLEGRSSEEIDAFRRDFPKREIPDQERGGRPAQRGEQGADAPEYGLEEVYDDVEELDAEEPLEPTPDAGSADSRSTDAEDGSTPSTPEPDAGPPDQS